MLIYLKSYVSYILNFKRTQILNPKFFEAIMLEYINWYVIWNALIIFLHERHHVINDINIDITNILSSNFCSDILLYIFIHQEILLKGSKYEQFWIIKLYQCFFFCECMCAILHITFNFYLKTKGMQILDVFFIKNNHRTKHLESP